MTETFLMCEPKYFEVNYIINPWMKGHVHDIDLDLAKQQWQDFYNNLKQYAHIELMEPQPKLPDLVFTANAGLVFDHQVTLSHFRYPQRRPEEPIFKRWFEENDFQVSELPDHIYFEGHGDGIFHSDKKFLWMGYGIRSELKSVEYLKEIIDIPIKPLELIDEKFYHLDTCLCPLLDDYVMYYPPAFSDEAKQTIEAMVPAEKRIMLNDNDAAHFVCNAVLVKTSKIPGKKAIIFVNAISNDLQAQLDSLGYHIQIQPVTEFRKAGGANQCLTLKLANE